MSQSTRIIAADMPILTSRYPIKSLLGAFRKLCAEEENVKLFLTGRRHAEEIYCVWNFLDEHGLTDRADFVPYYDYCRSFPVKKRDCDVWVNRHTPASQLTVRYLQSRLNGGATPESRYALFFTPFHPEKQEGNSTLMRLWLNHLQLAGYKVHLVYYMYDLRDVTADMRRRALHQYDLYKEVPVTSRLTGSNYNGLNLHVDDWCGPEALEAVQRLTSEYEYDVVITNYAFMSAIFERVAAYSEKILLAHDSFVDRNRRMLAQGYPESGWMSLDERGEQLACERSDVVIALQDEEAKHLGRLAGDPAKVRVIGPLLPRDETPVPKPVEKLRIGYFGSSNWVNEQNLGEYIKLWLRDSDLMARSEILVGGGVCDTLSNFVPRTTLNKAAPRMFGRVDDPKDFFAECDVIINPERGGTGIKIKSLEALAHGLPLLTTKAGAVGIGSEVRFHQAEDFVELVELTAEIAADPARLEELRKLSQSTYERYVSEQQNRLEDLLGPVVVETRFPDAGHAEGEQPGDKADRRAEPEPIIEVDLPQRTKIGRIRIPDYVKENAADYHFEEFEHFVKRVDVRGKRILEIGSDYHLISARLFHANGATEVVATNIGDWKSDEPLPDGVQFKVGDMADLDLPKHHFDIVYGIAVLEHIPDLEAICQAIKRNLKPDGIVYLQGCPLWPGPLGHHVYYQPESSDFEKTFAAGGSRSGEQILYSFAGNNPVPNWAHLSLDSSGLEKLLVSRGIPKPHARGMSRYVYNEDGVMIGSCSNFKSSSEVIDTLRKHFSVTVDRIYSNEPANEYFHRALGKYNEVDLRTLGLKVWMQSKSNRAIAPVPTASPKVSVIIPFYNVETFFDECLKSVSEQDYDNLEILLVDDASPDNSRRIAERYAAKDPRFKLIIHDKNQGLGPARNSGVEAASGAYLLFLDSDDFFTSPQSITTLVREAESTGCKVVIGSCRRLRMDGSVMEFDREFDKTHGGKPGEVVNGDAAYLGSSFIPGGQYVPMRSWGTLIDRFLYAESGLHFPAGEHEDLPHTPFLYYYAGQVLYIPDDVITYRDRPNSISNSEWDAGMIRRYAGMWRHIRENLQKFGLEEHWGDTALKTAEHLIMKLRQNGLKQGAEQIAIQTLDEILSEARGELNDQLFYYTMDSLRAVLDFHKYDYNLYHQLTGHIDPANMIKYYRQRLGGGFVDYGPVRISDTPDPTLHESSADEKKAEPAAHNVTPGAARNGDVVEVKHSARPVEADESAQPIAELPEGFVENETRVGEIVSEYVEAAEHRLREFPAMLTDNDKALYYHAGRHFQFRGSIVDAGCFIGGTTMSLVHGLLDNTLLEKHRDKLRKLIRVYDLFQIGDDYILEHLQNNYPGYDFSTTDSFLDIFRENVAEYKSFLDVRPGDVTQTGYADQEPIEVFGVDLCKSLPITDFVVREFFPRLLPDALVIQQDFIHEFHPHIHLSMLRLADCFERYVEIKWGGSVAFRCTKQITAKLIRERFGDDASWYNEVERNASLLRSLESKMLYDENRWVILLTLGVYYWQVDRHEKAAAIYREACERFPQFEAHETTRRLIGEAVAL